MNSVPYRPVYTVPARKPVQNTSLFRIGKNTGHVPAVPANIDHFGRKVKTDQYKKLLKKRKKNTKHKTKHKSTKWLTSPLGLAPLYWLSLTFSWFSLQLRLLTFLLFFFLFLFSSSYPLFRLQLHRPLGPFVLCGSCSLILCVCIDTTRVDIDIWVDEYQTLVSNQRTY